MCQLTPYRTQGFVLQSAVRTHALLDLQKNQVCITLGLAAGLRQSEFTPMGWPIIVWFISVYCCIDESLPRTERISTGRFVVHFFLMSCVVLVNKDEHLHICMPSNTVLMIFCPR